MPERAAAGVAGPTRRAVLTAAAWTAPTIAMAVLAPAAVASAPPADYSLHLSAHATGYSVDITVTPASGFPKDGHLVFRIPGARFLLTPVDYSASPWRNYTASLSNVHVVWAIRDVPEPRVLRVQFPDNVGDLQGASYEVWSASQQLMYSGSMPEASISLQPDTRDGGSR
ncbi:hypothetical protein ACEXOS_022560 [Herbiconiux sp. P16]|uniref:hypothetical protein n=1 Tax=Herbiconiux wuyangfengii TaxID=3342794 RepID=UPI003CF6A8FD